MTCSCPARSGCCTATRTGWSSAAPSRSLGTPLTLPAFDSLRSESFCDRRELGVVAVGGSAVVWVDGQRFELEHRDVLYVGKGSRDITFSGATADQQAALYLVSAISHAVHPTRLVRASEAQSTTAGSTEEANQRTVYRYVHADGAASSQLVLGITALEPGSVWNTMPCHLHDRRTEIYLYLDLPADARVIDLMGEPGRTRSIILADRQAIISPSWSVHCGAGTQAYSLVWAMAGENLAYTDVEPVPIAALR